MKMQSLEVENVHRQQQTAPAMMPMINPMLRPAGVGDGDGTLLFGESVRDGVGPVLSTVLMVAVVGMFGSNDIGTGEGGTGVFGAGVFGIGVGAG